jgi:hypothetical protein
LHIYTTTGPPDIADSITNMVHATLHENRGKDPEMSLLAKAAIKQPHPDPYRGSADLKIFEVFMAGILQWLSMNNMLGERAAELQLSFLGSYLRDEALEWFT